MGTVPGQMAKMGETAKKGVNRKREEGFRCGGGVAWALSTVLPGGRGQVMGEMYKAEEQQLPPKRMNTGVSFQQGERGTWRPT